MQIYKVVRSLNSKNEIQMLYAETILLYSIFQEGVAYPKSAEMPLRVQKARPFKQVVKQPCAPRGCGVADCQSLNI